MNEYRREYQVDIIVRAFGNQKLSEQCCDSIFDNTPNVPYQLIYIDNGSLGYRPRFDDDDPATVVRLPFNHGSVRAINVGLSLALLSEAPYILLLDNDTKIPDGDTYWLERFIEYFDDPKVGAAGAVTDFCAGPQHIERLPDRAEGQPPHEAPVLVSFAMMLRKEAVDQVLFFDEIYEPGNFEDYDYCLQLREAGWKCVIADGVFIHHEGHATFKDMNLNDLLAQNTQKFRDKWTAPKLQQMGVRL